MKYRHFWVILAISPMLALAELNQILSRADASFKSSCASLLSTPARFKVEADLWQSLTSRISFNVTTRKNVEADQIGVELDRILGELHLDINANAKIGHTEFAQGNFPKIVLRTNSLSGRDLQRLLTIFEEPEVAHESPESIEAELTAYHGPGQRFFEVSGSESLVSRGQVYESHNIGKRVVRDEESGDVIAYEETLQFLTVNSLSPYAKDTFPAVLAELLAEFWYDVDYIESYPIEGKGLGIRRIKTMILNIHSFGPPEESETKPSKPREATPEPVSSS